MNELNEYKKTKRTINIKKANLFAFFITIPVSVLYLIPFYIIWNEKFTIKYLKHILQKIDIANNSTLFVFVFFLVLTIGIILHELIHGVTFAYFAKKGFKSISFGILWKMLTPYCHCKEPLAVNQYKIAAIMPTIFLGLIPVILAYIFGSIALLLFAYFFTIAAVGDFLIVNLISKENKNSLILDHPNEIGYYVLSK